jgi:hypothetical protein
MLSFAQSTRASLSAAIGSSEPGYRVRGRRSALTAWSGPQGLSSSFSATGVSVRSGRDSLSMHLSAMGYGASLQPVGASAPRAAGNRVTYSHPGLEEWYANGPLGLEQGFTLARAPSGARRRPLTLAVALASSADPALSSDRRTVSFGSSPGGLRYTGLAAEDATGRRLQSWLSLSGGQLLLHVRATGARFPVRIDPFVQGEKFASSGGTANNHFSESVALSGDGKTAIVGAPYDEDGARSKGQAGAAFVFVLNGGKWEQQGSKLTGTGDEPIYFGNSVALSANGNTAIVGAYETAVGCKESEGCDQGAAYVFTRSGEKWSQQQVLLSGESEHDVEFGWSAALSGDGNTAIVGGPEIGNGTPHAGHVWFFTRSGEKWSQQGSTLTGASNEELGSGVALSGGEGNTALIGARGEEVEGLGGIGAAYIYTRSGSTWTQRKKIPGKGEGSRFGSSVALSGNGHTALIGAPEHASREGAAYIFGGGEATWKEIQELPGGPLLFGGDVALSGEGTHALVGREGAGGGVWAYTLSGEKWSAGEELSGSPESLAFGSAVALSENGDTALVGGKTAGLSPNAAWIFTYESPGSPPVAVTSPASEVTTTHAQLNGTVNPHGKEVTECKFEYGTTAAYGSTMACGSLPGKGEAPVGVSASVGGLTANTVYHFRVTAKTSAGNSHGEDRTLTTLQTSATGETTEPTKPATAKDEGLSVQASEGTGKVTIGPYGSHIGGPPLADSHGKYMQVYHSEGASFKKMEYEDCELGGAKAIWWENPSTGWEPIQAPVAVYNEGTKCIKVTATESTKPSIAQLSDPRHVGGAAGIELGKCEPTKHGGYADSVCKTPDFKKGVPKGKYEWLPPPVGCFGLKHGHYGAGCTQEDFSENKKTHEKKYKGSFEQGINSFKVAGGSVVVKPAGQPNVECTASSSSDGQMQSAIQSAVTLTLTGCERAGVKCASTNEPGTIVSEPLESYGYEESGQYFTVLAANTIMRFTCSSTEFRLSGVAAGQLIAITDMAVTGSETNLSGSVGLQELELEEPRTQARYSATLTTRLVSTMEQSVEFKVKA